MTGVSLMSGELRKAKAKSPTQKKTTLRKIKRTHLALTLRKMKMKAPTTMKTRATILTRITRMNKGTSNRRILLRLMRTPMLVHLTLLMTTTEVLGRMTLKMALVMRKRTTKSHTNLLVGRTMMKKSLHLSPDPSAY